jgi:hypothetical protein
MIYITKCSVCLSFIHRYSQVFNVVSLCHSAVVPSLSDFVPNPMNHVCICGCNHFCYPYHTTILILWGDFLWYLVLNFLWMEVGDCEWWNHKQHCTCFTPVYDSMTGRISKQLCMSGMPSEWGVWMKTWGLGTTFEMYLTKLLLLVRKLTADFYLTNLGVPCIGQSHSFTVLLNYLFTKSGN